MFNVYYLLTTTSIITLLNVLLCVVVAFLPGLLFWENLPGMTASPDTPCFAKKMPPPFLPLRQFTFVFVPPSSLTVCKPLTARAAISLSNGLEAAAPYLPAGGLFLYMCVSYSTHLVCISGGWREGCLLYPYRVGGV